MTGFQDKRAARKHAQARCRWLKNVRRSEKIVKSRSDLIKRFTQAEENGSDTPFADVLLDIVRRAAQDEDQAFNWAYLLVSYDFPGIADLVEVPKTFNPFLIARHWRGTARFSASISSPDQEDSTTGPIYQAEIPAGFRALQPVYLLSPAEPCEEGVEKIFCRVRQDGRRLRAFVLVCPAEHGGAERARCVREFLADGYYPEACDRNGAGRRNKAQPDFPAYGLLPLDRATGVCSVPSHATLYRVRLPSFQIPSFGGANPDEGTLS